MYSEVYGSTIFGLHSYVVRVEVDISSGLPCFEMSGLLTSEVREAKERVRIAIKNSGYELKPQRIVLNYSPANIKKSGTGLDLPSAVCILQAFNYIKDISLSDIMFIGELSFDGSIRKVKGGLPSVIKAKCAGFKKVIIPYENASECFVVRGIEIFVAKNLKDVVLFLNEENNLERAEEVAKINEIKNKASLDFSDICGQSLVVNAASVAVAGFHNFLMIGPPGSGKSMIAKRLKTIMPNLSEEESLYITSIYSIAGLIGENEGLLKERPYRSPGQNISESAMLGGGNNPRPGEVTLASKGVLFLDELTQYKSNVLEALRQPLEDRCVTVSRVSYSMKFNADFMLVGAMNPCKCGYYPDREKCNCSDIDISKYFGKLSTPFLDRFDITVRTKALNLNDFENKETISSNTLKERVLVAMQIQKERFKNKNYLFNSFMQASDIEEFCKLSKENMKLMEDLFIKNELTARGYHKILKVARTIADLEERKEISKKHLVRALMYRKCINV